MATYRVYLQQYVEMVATVEVEASDEMEARGLAKDRAASADWQTGDDAYSVEAYAVGDDAGNIVWER